MLFSSLLLASLASVLADVPAVDDDYCDSKLGSLLASEYIQPGTDGKYCTDASDGDDLAKLIQCIQQRNPPGSVDTDQMRPIFASVDAVNDAHQKWKGDEAVACLPSIQWAVFASPPDCMSGTLSPPDSPQFYTMKRGPDLSKRGSDCQFTQVYCVDNVCQSADDLESKVETLLQTALQQAYQTRTFIFAPASVTNDLWCRSQYGRSALAQNNDLPNSGYGHDGADDPDIAQWPNACGQPKGIAEAKMGSRLAVFKTCADVSTGADGSAQLKCVRVYVQCM